MRAALAVPVFLAWCAPWFAWLRAVSQREADRRHTAERAALAAAARRYADRTEPAA